MTDPQAAQRLAAQLHAFRCSDLFCDVTLLGPAGQRLPAHRAVLAAMGLLQPGDLASEVRFTGISKQCLSHFMDLIYAQHVEASSGLDVDRCCAALRLEPSPEARAVQLAERLHALRAVPSSCDLQLCLAGNAGNEVWAHRVVLAAGNPVLRDVLLSTKEALGSNGCVELSLQGISCREALEAALTAVYLGTEMPGATPAASAGDVALLCSDLRLPRCLETPLRADEGRKAPSRGQKPKAKQPDLRKASQIVASAPVKKAVTAEASHIVKSAKAKDRVHGVPSSRVSGRPQAVQVRDQQSLYQALLRGVKLEGLLLARHGGA